MYCKYCGKEIDNDSTFCCKCGKLLSNGTEIPSTKNLSKDKISSIQSESTVNIKILKEKSDTGEKARKFILQLLKQSLYIGLLIISAFIIKAIAYGISISTPIPEVTIEEQNNFNDEIFKLENPNGAPSFEELKANNFQRDYKKYPRRLNYSFGLIALEYLKLGEFKYDSQIQNMSQLYNINESRKEILEYESEKIADTTLWISLGILVGGYLVFLFIKWLIKNN